MTRGLPHTRQRRSRPRVLALCAVTAALAAALPGVAAAVVRPDPDAPAGAAADWLPPDRWVGERWLPFDERLLEGRLHLAEADIVRHLDATGDSLADLARQRGVRVAGLAAHLVAASRVGRSPRHRRVLRARARRVLTQSHLAAHMLGHVFHLRSITLRVEPYFGLSQVRFEQLYFREHVPLGAIAAQGGVDLTTLRTRVVAQARRAGRRAVARREMSRRQNALLRRREVRSFDTWAQYRIRTATAASSRTAVCRLVAR